jgi:CRP-like cAMP-binding protein
VRTPSGDKRVATLGAGDMVGEMSLMTGARRSATVTTLKPVTAVEIGKVALAAMIVRLPDLVQRFAGVMEQRQAELARIRDGHGWYGGGLSRAELAARMTAFYAG